MSSILEGCSILPKNKWLVSKKHEVFCWWGSETQEFRFISWVEEENLPL